MNEETAKELNSAKKDTLIFWLRMLGWLMAGTAAPITTFAVKFGLFDTYSYGITTDELGNVTGMNVALNGWGILSVVIIAMTFISMFNAFIDASGEYSIKKQVLVGVRKEIIPLVIVLATLYYLQGVIEQLQICVIVIAISRAVAIPLNPLPQWVAEKKGVVDYVDPMEYGFRLVRERFSKRKEVK